MHLAERRRTPMEILRIQLRRVVDDFCDQNRDQPEGQEQEQLVLMELEISINEALINTVDLHYQSNSEEPALPETLWMELRSRVCRSSVPVLEGEGPEACDPEKSFCDKALRFFLRLLCYLHQKWQLALAWVREVAAGVQTFCRAVEVICSVLQEVLQDFYYGVTQVFRSTMQA
ncbi:interleukin-32 isoform X1 [Canis aureus]